MGTPKHQRKVLNLSHLREKTIAAGRTYTFRRRERTHKYSIRGGLIGDTFYYLSGLRLLAL